MGSDSRVIPVTAGIGGPKIGEVTKQNEDGTVDITLTLADEIPRGASSTWTKLVCINKKCDHIFGLTCIHELAIGEACLIRQRATLICPKCYRARTWRPGSKNPLAQKPVAG